MPISILLPCLLLAIAPADAPPPVLDEARDGPPRAMLSRFLNGEAEKAFDARRAAVAAIKTPDDLVRRQVDLKARFLQALGDLPEKTPLNARVVAAEDRDGYRLERIVYESRPGHHVTALFYRPMGPPPFPAVLMPCGHDAVGKSAEGYQRACALLARNGIAALCFDPIGQGERRQVLGPDGAPIGPGGTGEHTLIHVGALLVGRSTGGYRVWDGIRSLDYLASRPDVDASRLGCTGCSGGGTMTSYLMALDDRVVAAAPSCYITSMERLLATIGPQDAEQIVTGQVAFGLEHADYLGLRAPRPTLILASTRDFFDIQGTWTSFREAKRTYGLLGLPERVDIIEADETHGYPVAHRQAMARWMRRWLLGKDEPTTEAELAVLSDAALLCTTSGQVLADLHGKSAFDLNGERADELARARAAAGPRDRDALAAEVRRLIVLRDPIGPAGREDRGEAAWGGGTVRRLVFETEPGVKIPARLFTPAKVDEAARLTVMVGYVGDEAVAPGGPVAALLAEGRRVLTADLRGMGETAPEGDGGLAGADAPNAYVALLLGRPLLGQRVGDLLAVLAALKDEAPGGLDLVGHGNAGPIALHAAVLEPKVAALTLDGAIASWADVVRTPLSRGQLANAVPGVLAVYDLPDLAAAFAPRPLTIRSPVDPAARPAPAERREGAATGSFAPRTRVSLRGDRWFINDRLTHREAPAEGLLMNVRMVNAIFEDRRRPDDDPDAVTDRFLANLPDYAAQGVDAVTLNLQGGTPGYEGALNSAFEPDGSLREGYLARAARVVEACDREGLVVILGCFYQRQDQVLTDEAAVRAGVANVAGWIRRRGYRNVVLEIANEFDHDGFDHRLIRSVEGQVELIRLARREAPGLLVSTSGLGHGRYPDALADAADFLLIHFNGTPLDDIPVRIAAFKRFGKPIVCNEDAKEGEAGARAAELSVEAGASWGLMLEKANQHHPFVFKGSADDPVVYAKLKVLTSPRTDAPPEAYFPPAESEGGWRKLDDPDAIRRVAGMDPARLADLREWLRRSDDRKFAAVVVRRGHIVLEAERGRSATTDASRVASCSKAVCATVLAIASEQSRRGGSARPMSFNDRAFAFIPQARPLSDPRKAAITVGQLLNHTSGLCPEAAGAPNDGTWEYILGHSGDPRTARLAFDPGTACGYSTHAFAHAALVCETVTGKPYDQFAVEALFRPLGIEHWWFQYYEGGPKYGRHPSHGLGMPARDMARIAYCMARRGRWKDRQVIPTWFVEATAAPTHDVHGPELRFKVDAQIFSYGWELPARLTGEGGRDGRGIPADARSKPGSGGQLIAFVPSLDLVVARQTGGSGGWEYEEFLRRACAAVLDES
ncbi:serine hydrolase [Planctomyces sp. SH-PL62]|uniref:serine hydrolase n=1 Tax=Planctomyces sp. SH-PL62 TaxID=1636152 RepID=UPI00078D7690|nr:serine hydrolase [Planctomyces sp. SH-PL62]AMV36053.1 beta-lactam binding protein AmpH [Planctomyces sp. SH-PL62]